MRLPGGAEPPLQLGAEDDPQEEQGDGRMRYEKELPRRFKNGFREQTQAPSRKRSTAA